MLCNRNAFELVFGKPLGDAGTLLPYTIPVSTAVTYIYMRPCASVVKHKAPS